MIGETEGGLGNPQKPDAEIKPPADMLVGQNLYAQRPFDEALEAAVLETGTDVGKLRLVVSALVKRLNRRTKERQIPNLGSEDRGTRNTAVRVIFGSLNLAKPGIVGEEREKYKAASILALSSLAPYPFWVDYLRQQLEADYRAGGEPHEQAKKPAPVPTYASFAAMRARSTIHDRFVGLAEELPKLATPDQPDALAGEGGPRPARRDWRSRKAAGTLDKG